jgi:1-acyl-sn-glycerol-3-phosphate acyltransferase
MAPILLILTAKESYFQTFYKVLHIWGKLVLFLMGFKAEITEEVTLEPNKSYMFSANHTSMIDPMLLLALVKNNPFVFVGKIELTKLPIFGYFYKKSMIIVDRKDAESRLQVFEQAKKRLDNGLSVCIFPEGLVPSDESLVLSDFKNGAFVLAIEHQIPIVPISFYDNKKRFSYTFFSGGPGVLRAKIHAPIPTKGMTVEKDKNKLKKQVFQLLYNDLNINQ